MRFIHIFLFSLIIFYACGTHTTNVPEDNKNETLKLEPNEEGEYDIIVFDAGYDQFLQAHALPLGYYSEAYLHNKNTRLVSEWNYRHSQPMRYNPNIYEVSIDYRPSIEYGLEFEWKLFNFFMFIELETGEDLDGLRTYSR